jgi:outer membrane protein assembly complex protein YaeT
MLGLKTFGRKLLLFAGCVAALGLAVWFAHSGVVRRFALSRIQALLAHTEGLTLEAGNLDYNLFRSHYELKDVVLRGKGLEDLPAPVQAKRVILAAPLHDLIRGSFNTAHIRIEGLAVHLVLDARGRSNLPSIRDTGPSAAPGGPAVDLTGGEIVLQDETNGLLVRLPVDRAAAAWNASNRAYGITLDASRGQVRWADVRLPIDRLQLKSAITGGGLSVESLRIASGDSVTEVAGALGGSPATIRATGRLDLDPQDIRQVLALKPRLAGRLQGQVTAAGPIDGFQVGGDLRLPQIAIGKVVLQRPAIDAAFDTASGELRIRSLSAYVFSGKVRATGALRTDANRGRSEVKVNLAGVNLRQVGDAFGASGLPSNAAALELTASCAGLDWRHARASGTVRSAPAAIGFEANLDQPRVHALLDGSWGDAARLKGDIAIDLDKQSLGGAMSGSVASLARAEHLLRGASVTGLDGSAHCTSTLGGTLQAPSASLQLQGRGLSFEGWNGVDLDLNAHYTPERIAISRAQVAWQGDRITASGEIGGASADAPLNLKARMVSPSVAPALRQLGVAVPVEADLAGDIRIGGSLAHPSAEAELHSDLLTVSDERLSRAAVEASWQNGVLTVSRFTAGQDHDSAPAGHIELSGSLEPANGRFSASVGATNLSAPAINGAFDLNAKGEGTLTDPKLQSELTGRDIRVGEIPLGDLSARVDASGRQAKIRLELPALHAQATSTIGMEGAWPFEFALDGKNTRLASSPAATFDATVRGSGSLERPEAARATASIQSLRLATPGQEIAGDGPVELSYSEGRIQARRVRLKAGDSELQITGEIPVGEGNGSGSLGVTGTMRLDALPKFLPALDAARVAGVAELNATITGTAERLLPEGSVTISGGSFEGKPLPVPVDGLAGKLRIGNGIMRLDELTARAGAGTIRAEGSLPLRLLSDVFPAPTQDPYQPARFSAKVEKVRLTGSGSTRPPTATLGVTIDGEASAFDLAGLKAGINFDELALISGDRDLRQTAPTRIAIARSVATLDQLELKGTNGSLRASGSVGLAGALPLQLDVAAQGDLAILSPLISPIETAGSIRTDLRIRGTLSDPRATGSMELDQARVAVPSPLIQAAGVKLRADFEGDKVTLADFSGTLNGGSFTGGGDLKLGGGGIRDANVFLKGKDVFAEIPAGLKTNSSLDVTLVSDRDRLVVKGRIEVQEGFFESPLDTLSHSPEGLEGSQPAKLGPQGASARPVGLDIGIVTKRLVEMDNNLGRIYGAADLRLAGTVDQPRLTGSVRLDPDGKLYFGDRVYYIERGTIRFLDAPKITPELDIHAYTRTNYYTIHLGLTGVTSEITSTFTSDPPLSREDVISVLLTGKTVADNRGVDVRTLEAMSVATGAMNAALSSRLHRTIGVSRVSIQPSAIAAESNPGTRVTITQDFTRTLRILYSMNLNDGRDQIWVGEYDLTRSLTTRLVKQSDNTYRGEFRHDVRFGGGANAGVGEAARDARRKLSAIHFIGNTPFAPDVLAKKFKVKAGKQYDALKVRKGAERLSNFFVKEGYLESRVRLDRDESANGVDVTVRIELGPPVEMTFQGADLPRGQKARLRELWKAGISDIQRPAAAKNAILDYFARKGYLRAQVVPSISVEGERKIVRFDVKPGIRYRDVKVVLQGAAPERVTDIQALIGDQHLAIGADRDPDRLTAAVTRYYQQRGYLAAKVSPPIFDLDEDGDKGRIVVPIAEGKVFRVEAVEFFGNPAIPADSLRAGLPVEAGQIFEPARLEPAAAAIRLKYGKLGYREASVEYSISRHDERAAVDLKFDVAENKRTWIRSIQFAGNRQTSVNFAQRRLQVAQGEVADTSKIRDSVTNLSRTGAYAAANIEMVVAPAAATTPEPQPGPEKVARNTEAADLTVAVVEPKPFRVLYGGLYDSGSGPGFIFDFQNLNSLGPGRTLGVRARYDSDTKEGRVYLTQPYWGSKQVSSTLSAYFTNEVPYGQDYPTAKAGIGFQQDWPLGKKLLLSYGVRFEKERAWLPVNGVEVRTPIVFAAPLTLTLSRDARDSFLDATRGSFISDSIEFAPNVLGTEYRYIRDYLQYFKYFPLTRPRPAPYGETPNRSRLVFATGTRIGVQKGLNSKDVVLTDRFYAGGGTTVRGFQQDSLGPKLANGAPIGGNAVFIFNNELRYPLFWILDAVSFIDIGNVFAQVSDFRFGDLRKAAGFGLRVRNPFVVLRFDYGFKLDRRPGEKIGAFFFSIGQAF